MRYIRQKMMKEIGEHGQDLINKASIIVIGAGGLGCFVLNELVLAGVGKITIIENDEVAISNLNRQFIYKESDLGKSKIELASAYLHERNTSVTIMGINERLNEENVDLLLKDGDIIVDCVDNIETRMIVNDYCVKNDIPLVEAGVNGLYGFVMSIRKDYPCLRCIGYQNTKLKKVNDALGAAVGIIGSIEALEALKILLGLEDTLFGYMLNVDLCDYSMDKILIKISDTCMLHKD